MLTRGKCSTFAKSCSWQFTFRTDELIQRAIRDISQRCTVLTVAHRLRTVIDSDRILVRQQFSISLRTFPSSGPRQG